MTALTARAYADFLRDVESLGCAKLHASELDTFRAAADAAVFGDDDDAIPAALELCGLLADSERMSGDRVERLRGKLLAIGCVFTVA